jgi:predicted membrane protein
VKQILTRIDTTLLILLTASIFLIEFNERNSTFFLAWVLMLVLFLFFITVLIYSFVRSYKSNLIHPRILKFIPFVLGVLMIPVLLIMSSYLKNGGFKSVVLKAYYEGRHNEINLTLYKDNTFQLLNSGPFGGDYIRGSYKYDQDTLYIENEKVSKIYPAGKLVLKINERKEKYFYPVITDTSTQMILQVERDQLTNR